MNLNHVKESRRALFDLGMEERVQVLSQEIWVDIPQASDVLRAISNILDVPRTTQAPCMLVCGEPGTGKSSLVGQLLKRYEKSQDSRLAFMNLAEDVGSLKFKERILVAMGIPLVASRKAGTMPSELAAFIRLRNIRGIVIDEFHDALLLGKVEQQRNLSVLKSLSGPPYFISVIGFGTDYAKHALNHDSQLSRRYHMMLLQPWTENETFRRFLASIEENLPLKHPSALYSPEIVKFLLKETGGVMGLVVDLIKSAAAYAIYCGEERISIEMLEKAKLSRWGYGK
ncbi:TniB family NTP-binding protein [Pseudomonas sp. MAHUQ-62]|uniref:TniB family NTP-binding protein n=1 Tax=Pseudomonas sp. GCM10023245 TaxID=3252652 RepID=UPI0036089A75